VIASTPEAATLPRPRPVRSRPLAVGAATVAGVGIASWLLALRADPSQALHAWLTAWSWATSTAVGALCLVMIGHVTGARWFVAVRRVAEATAMALPALAIGVVPVLVGGRSLYPWARPPELVSDALRERLEELGVWFVPEFFALRSLVYLASWVVLAALLWRSSVAQDRRAATVTEDSGGPGGGSGRRAPRPNAVGLSAFGLIVLGFTVTFASFDWLMSLTPEWYSTIFGAYWFAGAIVAALSALVIVTRVLSSTGALDDVVGGAHYHALGRLLLAFVVFWAYIAYSQGFLVWIANVPHEVEWYLARTEGEAVWLLAVLAAAHFLIPFLALLNHALKRRPRPLSWIAGWLLVLHWVDTSWLVGSGAPNHDLWSAAAAHLAALAAVAGGGVACGAWLLDGESAAAHGDPGYATSLHYRVR
jgi:hypothetical protein